MRKSTILIVTTSYPIVDNGSEAAGSFVSDLATELSFYHNIRIVAPGKENTIEQQDNGIIVYRFSSPDSALSNLKLWNPYDAIRIIKILCNGKKATAQAVHDGKVGHILALWALPSGYWAKIQAKKLNIDYSVWTLGSDIWSLSKVPIVRHVLTSVLREAKYRFSDGIKLGKDTSDLANKETLFLPSTRSPSPKSIQPLNLSPPFKLLFIGRWHSNKGIDLLLESLMLLNDNDWEKINRVDIYGGGPLEEKVQSCAADLKGLGRPVHIHGFIKKDEAEDKILNCDYVLIPSRIESIPLIFSDAIKLGKPVISTPVGDLPSLISPGTGVLSTLISPTSYVEAIRAGLHHPQMDSNIIQLCAKQFDLNEIALSLVNKLLPNKDS